MRKFLFVLVLLGFPLSQLFSISKIDSLTLLLNKTTDTTKINVLFELIDLVIDNDPPKSLKYIEQASEIAKKKSLYIFKGRCLKLKGDYFKKHGDYTQALELYHQAVEIFQKNKAYKFIASVYNNIGATYVDKGDYQNSATYLIKSLRIFEQINDKASAGRALLNIGLMFYYQHNWNKALEYYNKSLEIREKLHDKKGLGLIYNNIGVIYSEEKKIKPAIENFKKSLRFYTEIGNLRGMGNPLYNIAELYTLDEKLDSAMVYYNKSYAIDTLLKDKESTSTVLIKLAFIYGEKDTIGRKPLDYAFEALKLAKEVGSKEDIKTCYKTLAQLFKDRHNWQKAFEFSELSSDLNDTIFSKQSAEAIAELQTKYETEKKDIALNHQQVKIKQQKLIFNILLIACLFGFLYTLMILWQYIQKKRAFKILEVQKKNITDSINYASRIQTALLPPEDILNKLLPNHFILYMPRDIVSGDFYWITISGEKTIVAVADCTGHGVPGAFMSMLGFAYLNEIVNKSPDIKANEILNELRNKVKLSLHQGENSSSKDGMDIALAVIDLNSKKLQFSGANNPLLICRNNEIISLLPDKMPIGIHSLEKTSFTVHEIKLEKDDIVYMFSDGYMDQFGGEKMKKLGKVKFENELIEASKMNIKAQKYYLEEKILEWMVDTDQIDDILVLGIKV